jgi:transcriptional regulator with XRE-family HTH domain
VGTALGLSNSTVSRYEQGRQIPSLKTLLQLELLFRMPIAYLYQEFYAELRDGMRQPPSNPVSSEHTAAAQEVNHA